MTLQHGLFTLALSALLLAPAARADDFRRGGQHDASPVGTSVGYGHTGGGYRPAPPPPPSRGPRESGRYELRTVQRWVPGHYEKVWVEETCKYKPRRDRVKCQGGYYEQRWVEGYNQSVQEWVWIPSRRGSYVASNGW